MLRPGTGPVQHSSALQRRTRVLIAGGGIAGLAAARALRLAGVEDFAILELEDEAGGNSRGGTMGGRACPRGAHYLPTPGEDACEVQDMLEEMGVRRRLAGRWSYDERQLCHSPQERLFYQGAWHDGLLPRESMDEPAMVQLERFSQAIAAEQRADGYTMPRLRATFGPRQRYLASLSFDLWLDRQGFTDPMLRWYLDYCCRDDYGAGSAVVSAWAGVHYFASRHTFAPLGDAAERGVLTWPEGNARLARHLAGPAGERILTARTVLGIEEARHGVEVLAFDHRRGLMERWHAHHCILALPVHASRRILRNIPAPLDEAARRTTHAAWVVCNLLLDRPLADRGGAAPSWDNVLFGSPSLGYVDAGHQRLDPRPGPTVLSWYAALGTSPEVRKALLDAPWTHWRDRVLADLSIPHPDLVERTQRFEVTRYGHAMAVPVPDDAPAWPEVVRTGRIFFAHADWSAYSVFEEAFTRGHLAGMAAARA